MTHSTGKELVKVQNKLSASPAWQRLWLTLESENWRSLAIVPAGPVSAIRVAHGLAAVAWGQPGARVVVADLRTIGLPVLAGAREELRKRISAGDRILIATQAVNQNPTAVAIAREADKTLLCVAYGQTIRSQIHDAVNELGANRFLGSVMVRA